VNAYSKRVQKSDGKSDVVSQPAQPPKCPECGSIRVWKSGFSYTNQGKVQRFECRDCGYRFSDPYHMNKNLEAYTIERRVCVSDGEMKNLATVEPKTEVRTSPIAEKIVNYLLYLKRIGRKDSTIETYNNYINILSKSNLEDPDAIALFINEHWTENSTRSVAVSAYDAFLKSIGKTWNRPHYKQESKIPFIPTDEELQQAILTGKKPSMTFSQLLYETGARTNEAERIQWEDIDYARKKIYIKASKNGNARFITVTDKLLNMIGRLPRKEKQTYIFPKRGRNTRRVSFSKRMERLARLTSNNRYRKIHFHTFRHVFALRTYHRIKDALIVKTLLGHKSLMTTQRYLEIYAQIYGTDKPDQFVTKIAVTKEERITLINDGWTFIKNDGDDWYFRKPK
jgi:integrase